MSEAPPTGAYERYRAAIGARPLPLALVDLEAFLKNTATLVRAAGNKQLRVASKSVRSVELLERIRASSGAGFGGVMTYTARETAHLASEGFSDLLLAYPTLQRADVSAIAGANREGTSAAVVVDDARHLAALEAAAKEAGTRVPVVVDVDVGYRPVSFVHVGVRRSPLYEIADVVAFARRASGEPHLVFRGIMGYEAQIAGVPDHDPFAPLLDAPKRAMKARSRVDVAARRSAIVSALTEAGLPPALVNGGGTGSIDSSAADPSLTEVTAGSGFLDSHLFDHYRGVSLAPAAYFALQVVRAPGPGVVTCLGGGYVASGAAGASRLPVPALPAGLSLTSLEGAGEVQTPLTVPAGVKLDLGDPVFFRHAKAGELAEHFNAYALVQGDAVVGEARTYRGLGFAFLG